MNRADWLSAIEGQDERIERVIDTPCTPEGFGALEHLDETWSIISANTWSKARQDHLWQWMIVDREMLDDRVMVGPVAQMFIRELEGEEQAREEREKALD